MSVLSVLSVLQVVDFYNFSDLSEVTSIKSSSLELVMHTGGRVILSTNKAGESLTPDTNISSHLAIAVSIRDLINQFIIEARSGQFEYCRVLADFTSREENALLLSAGEIVAVVPKDDPYTQRGQSQRGTRHLLMLLFRLALRNKGRQVRTVPGRLRGETLAQVHQKRDKIHLQDNSVLLS